MPIQFLLHCAAQNMNMPTLAGLPHTVLQLARISSRDGRDVAPVTCQHTPWDQIFPILLAQANNEIEKKYQPSGDRGTKWPLGGSEMAYRVWKVVQH